MVKINKNTISDFADSVPLVALATKSKLFDTSFSSTSELILFHLKTKAQTITKSEHKFCKVKWCEMEEDIFLAAGHEDGFISIYKVVNNNFELIVCKQYMRNNDDIIGIDFFPAKKMICVISNTGKILFLNLTDLKEYFLEINIDSPTCISWNKKVSKILAIGTNKGGVKLVDIKKNSVIISSDGFQTIKNVMWDSNTPTKLLIQSEKQSITEHELSNDLKLEKENYGSEIISFNNEKIVISEFIIDVNTNAKFPIPLSTSVSLGKNHACLHLKDGTTEILSIPKLPVRKGFFRIENKIFTGKNVFVVGAEHVVDEENTGNEDVDSSFYDNLKDQKGTEIYKFLIENASSIPPCFQGKHTENKISVDLDNKEHLALVTGDFSVLKNCKEKVEIGFLVSLLNNDTSAVSKATSFSQLIIMSKLLNNYSMLTKISNSRVLAAIILCNNLDINILNETDREGKIIKGILTNDNSIISDRIVLNDNFYQNLGKIKKYLGGLSSPIESDYLSEYFWFMVAQGKYEEVKNLCVNDLLINNYKESKNVVCAFKNVHVSRNSNNFPNSQQGNFISQKSAVKTFSPATGRIQQPSGASPKAPLGMQSQQPAFPRTHQMSPSPKPMNTPVNQTPQSATRSFPPCTGKPPGNSFVKPPGTPLMGRPSMQRATPMMPSSKPMGVGSVPPMNKQYPPVQNFTAMGAFQQKPPLNLNGNNVMRSEPGNMNRSQQYSQTSTSYGNSPMHPGAQSSSYTQHMDVPRILNEFDALVRDVKQKVSMVNSVLLNQKKNRFLMGLESYNNVDKRSLSTEVLQRMDELIQRMKNIDSRLKYDIDSMNLSMTSWLQSLAELIKIGY